LQHLSEDGPSSPGCRLLLFEPADQGAALSRRESGDLLPLRDERDPFALPGSRDPKITEELAFGFVLIGEMNVGHPQNYAKTDIRDIG
jgi:hypothetical protein